LASTSKYRSACRRAARPFRGGVRPTDEPLETAGIFVDVRRFAKKAGAVDDDLAIAVDVADDARESAA